MYLGVAAIQMRNRVAAVSVYYDGVEMRNRLLR